MALTEEQVAEHYATALQMVREIAETYYFQGSLDEAFHLWQVGDQLLADRVVLLTDRVKFLLGYGSFLINNYFLTQRDEDLMQATVLRAQEDAEALQDEFAIATSLFLTGQMIYYHNLLTGASDYTKARDYLEQTSALRERIGDEYNLAESLFYTGLTYDRAGPSEQSERYLQRALELAEQQGNTWAASEAHRHLTDYTEGEQRFAHALRSLELRQRMGFKRGLPPAQLLLGEVCVAQGDLASAAEYCQQADQLAREMGLRMYLVDALLLRSDIAFSQAQPGEAREYLEQAAALAQQLNHARGLAQIAEKRERLQREQPPA